MATPSSPPYVVERGNTHVVCGSPVVNNDASQDADTDIFAMARLPSARRRSIRKRRMLLELETTNDHPVGRVARAACKIKLYALVRAGVVAAVNTTSFGDDGETNAFFTDQIVPGYPLSMTTCRDRVLYDLIDNTEITPIMAESGRHVFSVRIRAACC